MTVSRRAVIGALGAGLTLAACSTGSTGSAPSETPATGGSSAADAGAFPVTIKDSLGSATITKAPTRIATLGIGNEDYLVALGVVPTLVPAWNEGANARKSTDWLDDAVQKLGKQFPAQYSMTDSVPVDEVAKATPDLNFGPYSGLTDAEYAKLTKIAPTVAAPGNPYGATWQQSLAIAGQATGKQAEAATAKTDLEKQIADAIAKYPAIKGKTVAVMRFFPDDKSKIYSTTTLDPRQQLMQEFGFATPQFVTDLTKANPQSYGAPISAEKAASTVDADVIIVLSEQESDLAAMKSDALLGAIPALKKGAYVALATSQTTTAFNTPTVLSIPVVLESTLPKLGDAAGKAA